MNYLLAIDQGTTGTTSTLMDENLQLIAQESTNFPQYFPKPGWVEHDLEEIWKSVLETVQKATRSIQTSHLLAIGIANQRETLCFWDQLTHAPLCRAIVWQDRRSTALCQKLKAKKLEPFFQDATGLLLDPYFSGTKAAWALENNSAVQAAQKANRLAIGTIDSFLLFRLTGGKVHATEPSNASRTLCFHLTQHSFQKELCDKLKVPVSIWPEVYPSIGIFGKTSHVPGLPDGIPISGILGDQQAALLGQACLQEGLAKCTYGTGAFLLMNTGKKPIKSRHRLLSTIAWNRGTEYTYALEGSAFIAGAAIQWLQEGLELIQNPAEAELLAQSVPSTEGVSFVPALAGLGAPYWNPEARGLFTGLTRGTTRAHLIRAVLEGIAFQNRDLLTAMEKDLPEDHPGLKTLHVDGGAALNSFLMQFQANILGVPLKRPLFLESTSLGAIFAAALGVGIWKDFSEIQTYWKEDRTFLPQWDKKECLPLIQEWHRAVHMIQKRDGKT